MAYHLDSDNSIIIDGFNAGIGDSPYAAGVSVTGSYGGGLTDMRNVNIISIPGEASVAFSTVAETQSSVGSASILGTFSGNIASTDASGDTVTYSGETGTPMVGMAVVFLTLAGSSGLSTGTTSAGPGTDSNVYWISSVNTSAKTFQLSATINNAIISGTFNITGNGTGTFTTINIGQINYFDSVAGTYAVDVNGRAWYLRGSIWSYAGNLTRTNGNGNGIVTYSGGASGTFVFVFRNALIDYAPTTTLVWVYGWNPATGLSGASGYMQTSTGTNNSHQPCLGGSDNRIYYPDANYVSWFSWNSQINVPEALTLNATLPVGATSATLTGSWSTTATGVYPTTFSDGEVVNVLFTSGSSGISWQNGLQNAVGTAIVRSSISKGTAFDPTNPLTYTYSPGGLILPPTEVAQCVAVLATNLLVGGMKNLVYSWDRTSSGYSPIYIAENVTKNIVIVNTNAYLFAGNRGRIYVTNGSQAQLYKKVPDHLSNTIEPYFTWGGACSQKNQLYFGVSATTNAGVTINQYGGLWAIDLDTTAIRLSSQLSYGTYAGLATALYPISGVVTGFGLYIGWNSGASTYGIDATSSNVYTGGQSYVISDLIPVGTFIKKKTYSQVEFKLSVPMVSGESVQLLVGSTLTGALTSCGTNSTIGAISDNFKMPIEALQWLKVQAILTGTNSTPSYCRLYQLRIY